jgi:WD40 repeat protein
MLRGMVEDHQRHPPPHRADVEVLAFALDGKTIAAATPDGGLVQLRDATTGQVLGELRGPRDRVTALVFGPDGRLFTGSPDATVRARDPPASDRPPADRR